MIPDDILPFFLEELDALEKQANVAAVRQAQQTLRNAEGAYRQFRQTAGVRRFLTAEGRAARGEAKGNLAVARANFNQTLANARSNAISGAARLGPDAAEHAATANAVRRARAGADIPANFSPAEQAATARAAAGHRFRRNLALSGAAAGGAALYLGSKPKGGSNGYY